MDEFEQELAAIKRKDRRRRLIGKLIILALFSAPIALVTHRLISNHLADQEYEEKRQEWLRLKDHEVDELRRLIDRGRKDLRAARNRWVEQVQPAALEELAPGEARCSHSLRGPTPGAARSYIQHGSIDGNYFGNVSYRLVAPGQPIPPSGIDYDLAALDKAAAKLDAGTADRYTLRSVRDRGRLSEELIVVGTQTRPFVSMGAAGITSSYTSGRIQGRAYLYSHRTGVRCVADLDVKNSSSVQFSYSHMQGNFMDQEVKARQAAQSTLDSDLRVNLMWAITAGLRQVVRQPADQGTQIPETEQN